jgi:hypothetical protein
VAHFFCLMNLNSIQRYHLYLSENTACFHYKHNRLMLYGERVDIYCENHTKYIANCVWEGRGKMCCILVLNVCKCEILATHRHTYLGTTCLLDFVHRLG